MYTAMFWELGIDPSDEFTNDYEPILTYESECHCKSMINKIIVQLVYQEPPPPIPSGQMLVILHWRTISGTRWVQKKSSSIPSSIYQPGHRFSEQKKRGIQA